MHRGGTLDVASMLGVDRGACESHMSERMLVSLTTVRYLSFCWLLLLAACSTAGHLCQYLTLGFGGAHEHVCSTLALKQVSRLRITAAGSLAAQTAVCAAALCLGPRIWLAAAYSQGASQLGKPSSVIMQHWFG